MSRLYFKVLPVVAATGLLAACSTMPEWTKPTTWIDGVSDPAKPAEKAETTPVTKPAADATADANPVIDPLATEPEGPRIKTADTPTEFPNINTQPEPRQVTTTESQRREIRDSLVADRDNAQHTADELKGGTQAPAAPPPPAAKNVSNPAAPAASGDSGVKKPEGSE